MKEKVHGEIASLAFLILSTDLHLGNSLIILPSSEKETSEQPSEIPRYLHPSLSHPKKTLLKKRYASSNLGPHRYFFFDPVVPDVSSSVPQPGVVPTR